MFIAGTVDWAVRNMDDEAYPVYVVWESGGKLLGVAGGNDGLAELFIDVVVDYEKSLATKRPMPTTYPMISVQRKGLKVTTQEFVATVTPDDVPNADPLPDIGKGGFGAKQTNHHIVVRKAARKARK